MAEWIDVDDRLPDSDRPVWVTLKSGNVEVDWFDPYEPEWDKYDGRVTAWMEIGAMPEPYKPTKKVYKPVYIREHDCCECDNYRGRLFDEAYCCIHGWVTGVCEDFVYGSEE